MRLGIDFGTTRTVIASVEDGKYPVSVINYEGDSKNFIPTLLAVKEGSLLFGWDAINCIKDPNAYIRIPVEERPDLLGSEIVETYLYDANGMIRVSMENRTTGYRKEYIIAPGSGDN